MPNQSSTLESEQGAIANLRFLLSPIGSTTVAASLLGADVYNIFCCGRESYAGVEMEGANAPYIYRPAIFDSALALNASVGWKAGMAQVIQNDSWLLNMRCTLA